MHLRRGRQHRPWQAAVQWQPLRDAQSGHRDIRVRRSLQIRASRPGFIENDNRLRKSDQFAFKAYRS